MNTELIQRLLTQVEQTGAAKYRAYVMQKTEQGYEVLMNNKPLANFIVTGYEQGYLSNNAAKTAYQIKTVNSLQAYLTGQH